MSTPGSVAPATTTLGPYKSLIPSVLLWKNPAHSGTVLAEALGAVVVLRYGAIFRFLLRIALWAIFLSTSVEFVSRKFTGAGLVSAYRPSSYLSLSKIQIEKGAQHLAALAEYGLDNLKALIDCRDVALSAAAWVALFTLYVLSKFLTFTTLLLLTALAAFSLPLLAVTFEKEIDDVLALVHKHAKQQYDVASKKAYAVAGPHIETAQKQVFGLASKLGYSRGGPPPSEKSTPLAASQVPGAAAAAPSGAATKAPKVSEHAVPSFGTTAAPASSSLKTESFVSDADVAKAKAAAAPASSSLKTESHVSDADVAKSKAAAAASLKTETLGNGSPVVKGEIRPEHPSSTLKTENLAATDASVQQALKEAAQAESVPTLIGNVQNKF